MLNSGNDNKPFSLVNIIEEQLNNISFSSGNFNLETDATETTSLLDVSDNVQALKYKNESFDHDNKEIEDLSTNEARWFYKNTGKSWIEFSGYDSLQLENAYRRIKEECNEENNGKETQQQTSEIKSALENSKEKRESQTINQTTNQQPKSDEKTDSETSSSSRRSSQSNKHILVRGGLYEADILSRKCASIYWPGEEFVIIRGSWFYETWQPLEEDQADILENVHLALFKGKKPSEIVFDSNAKAIHSEVISEFHIDWYSPNEVYLYSQATPSKIVRSFAQKIGIFQKSTGSKLLRGYKYLATEEDKQTDIEHLVFVVHGIGQKMNIGAQIFRNTSLIRERVSSLKEKYFSDFKKRVEFFPVEWRSNLSLDGGTVDAITPLHVKMLRQLLNTSAMDIMFYTSPVYCAEVQDGLTAEMNRLYSMFRERNPHIEPKVSVIAHSLGAVIVYDIITGWLPMGASADGNFIPGKSRLNFELDNFFCIGSPLSVFLAMRVPKGQLGYHLFPPSLCNRLYNIYHLTDPVAYRLEPLIVKDYARISPLVIQPYDAVNPIPYCDMLLEPLDPEAAVPQARPEEATTSPTDTPTHREKKWRLWDFMRGAKSVEGSSSPQMESPVEGLEHRLDYVQTCGAAGPLMIHSVFTSHTAYWSSLDVAHFILTRIFPELEPVHVLESPVDTPVTST